MGRILSLFRSPAVIGLGLLFSFSNVRAQIITTIAGGGTILVMPWGDGGPATIATLEFLTGVAVDGAGNVYIADQGHHRVRLVNTAGIISTFAGGGIGGGGAGDGGPATAANISPYGLLLDGAGNVYISDYLGTEVRKVNAANIISTFAGNFSLGGGYSGDHGPATAATLSLPDGMARDGAGNVYIADEGDNVVRRVDPAGIITTFAGNGTGAYSGDGMPATAAELFNPVDAAVDGAGNVYIADRDNNVIRKVNTSGIISTFAGNGLSGYSGDGLPATAAGLFGPSGVATDGQGNVYIADAGNSVIRKVDTRGIITTIVGTGTPGYTGDGGAATAATIYQPLLIRVDCGGNLYIPDYINASVRRVIYDHAPSFAGGHAESLSACAGVPTSINSVLAAFDVDTSQTATWSVLSLPKHGTAAVAYSATTTGGTITPTGQVYAPFPGYLGNDTFSVIVTDCGHMADTVTIYVRVNTGPAVDTIAGPAALCTGAAITLTDDTTGGAWGSTNTTASVAGGVVNGLKVGIDTITYAKTNTCGTTTVMHPVIIADPPVAGVISGLSNVCAGSVITLTDPATGGVWSSSNTSASVIGGIVSGLAGGTAIISYSVTNVCATAVATDIITVTPLPGAGVITGLSSVCVGAAITLSDAVTGGVWNSSNTTASISGRVVSGAVAGIDTISYFFTNVCGTAVVTKNINVLPLPDAGVITGAFSVVCVGGTITLTDATGGGVWNSSNFNAGVSAGVVTGLSVGTATISYSVTNSCTTATAIYDVTISSFVPVTAPVTGATSEFCAGTSVTLSDATIGGVWSSSNGRAFVSGGVVTGLSGGIDTIRYSLVNGCGSAMSVYTVTIDPLPNAGKILGPDESCAGLTITLGDDATGGVWSISDGTIASISAGGIVKGLVPGTATITYTITNACGTSSAKYMFTVVPLGDCITKVTAPLPAPVEQVTLYPNPNTGMFTLNISSANDEQAGVVITNIVGEKVKEFSAATNTAVAVKLEQPAGIYLVSVTTTGGKQVVKIIIE